MMAQNNTMMSFITVNKYSLLGLLVLLCSTGVRSQVIAPNNGHQFYCTEYGLPDNSTWTLFDQCYSYALEYDPFQLDSLASGKYAVITDVVVTPTTSTIGSYYVGVAQSSSAGNNFNPQVFLRGSDNQSLRLNQTGPLLVVSEGNTLRAFNSSSSPGSVRVVVTGYITDDLTVITDVIFEDGFD